MSSTSIRPLGQFGAAAAQDATVVDSDERMQEVFVAATEKRTVVDYKDARQKAEHHQHQAGASVMLRAHRLPQAHRGLVGFGARGAVMRSSSPVTIVPVVSISVASVAALISRLRKRSYALPAPTTTRTPASGPAPSTRSSTTNR